MIMTPQQATNNVQRKFPGYVIGYCVPYKSGYVVMAHPDDGPEDHIHGAYPDPFYFVDSRTGKVAAFVPATEKDFGRKFFDTVRRMVK